MNAQEFDDMVGPFLEAQDDQQYKEIYQTEREIADSALRDLRKFLFKAEIAKEERRKQYLELKAEFEPYL